MVAIAYGTVPASAASKIGCSGENLAKTESAVEAMADGSGKFAAQREIAQAQDAMLNGKSGACAMHLSRAMNGGSMAQMNEPYPAYQPTRPTQPNQIIQPAK